jgi:hypothetical protein
MSGLCLTPSELANKKFAAQSIFYPQSYPQLEPLRKCEKSRQPLFLGSVRGGKTVTAACAVENNRV